MTTERVLRIRTWRRRVAYSLGVLVALVFLMQGWAKLDPDGFWTAAFERWGYPVWFRYATGVLEIAGAVFLLIPKLATYGAGTLGAVMIGAFVTRLRDGQTSDVVTIAVYLLLLVWFALEWKERRWRRSG